MLFMLEDVRRSMHSTLALEYQYRLFALRDELRAHIIANPELTKSWVFAFLDSTITKLVTLLPTLSIWKMISLLFMYRNSQRMRVHRANLEREYKKPENAKFEQIELKLMAVMGKYIEKRHAAMLGVLNFLIFKVLKNMVTAVQNVRKDSLVVTVEAPETSTLNEHCPA
jgi:hypothetical protein